MSLQDWVQYFIEGFPVGCVYALVAIGLVLTYKTSGVFNLAFGAQAFLSAAVMYEMRQGEVLGIGPQPMWLCLVVSVFIVAPLVGLIFDRALFRYMRNSSWVTKLVVSLGLFVALPEIVKALLTGVKPQFRAPSISPTIGIDRIFGISAADNEPLHDRRLRHPRRLRGDLRGDAHHGGVPLRASSATRRWASGCGRSSRASAWSSSPGSTASA